MNSLIFTETQHEALGAALSANDEGSESCALLLGSTSASDRGVRFLVQEVHVPRTDGYKVRTSQRVELAPEYFVPRVRKWRGANRFVGFAHSHPFSDVPAFSSIDDATEGKLLSFLELQFGSAQHVSVVAGTSKWIARQLGKGVELGVRTIGAKLSDNAALALSDVSRAYARQILAFGVEGQEVLQRLRIGIVGLGGTGSLVAQQLAYLGARFLRLVDFDVVDSVNLNRLVGATVNDVNRAKVDVVRRHLLTSHPGCEIDAVIGDVVDEHIAHQLIDCDLIFGCTDSHGSRAILNQIAYQHYIPCFDMGVAIAVADGRVSHVAGRAQMLSPGLGCLTCGNLLDAGEVRQDLMTAAQRRNDPYIVGAVVPQPSVVTLNSVVASLAVSMCLGAVTGIPLKARLQLYDGVRGTVRPARIAPVERCVVCSSHGALGRGDSWPLPTRKSVPS